MKRLWLAACLIAAMMTVCGCGLPSGRTPDAAGTSPVSPGNTETGSPSTAGTAEQTPAATLAASADASPAASGTPAATASAGTESAAATGDAGYSDATTAVSAETANPSASAGTTEPADDAGAAIIVRSDNALSSAEKEALLKELETELDSLFDAIDKIDDSTEAAMADEEGQ